MSTGEIDANPGMRTCPSCENPTDETILKEFEYCCPKCGFEVAHTDRGPAGNIRGILGYLKCSGQLIDERYRVESVLGKGGFGVTYLVEDLRIKGKRRALKEIPELLFDEKEIDLLVRLRHAAIPDVTDRFTNEGMIYLVLQFGGRWTLDGRCRELGGKVPMATAIVWMREVCDVLSYLHSQEPPIIHRDLKPENILLDDDNHIMLIDFGIAKVSEPATVTRVQGRAFSHGFSPPEQVMGVGTEVRSDIYSFGATFYYILTGHVPPAAHERLVGHEIQLPSVLSPDLPPELDKILLSCLNLNMDLRPASIPELKSMLQILNGELRSYSPHAVRTVRLDQEIKSTISRPSWPPIHDLHLSDAHQFPARKDGNHPIKKHRFLMLSTIMMTLMVALAAGVYFLSTWKKSPPESPPEQPIEIFSFEKPVATISLKDKVIIYQDQNLQIKTGEMASPGSVEITGFVRDAAHRLSAVQIKAASDQKDPSYVRSGDVEGLKQLDENGAYLQIILASSLFSRNGKATANETMKGIDAYITKNRESKLEPYAFLDYLLCLDWLFRNGPSTNKAAVIRLAEMYLAKAKERYPNNPRTQRCEALVKSLKAAATQ